MCELHLRVLFSPDSNMSQILAVLSPEPETIKRPSLEKSRE
jgi:hypothetical protein